MGERIDRVFMALSAKTSIDGLWIGVSLGDDPTLLRKLYESIRLIKTYDPRRYIRLRKDIRMIWITLLPGAYGTYKAELDCCQIDSRFAAAYDPMFIASVIVHEATHARLRRFGYAEAVRHRVEVACRGQEIAFSRKLPDGQDLTTWLERGILSPEDYTYENWARGYNDGLIAAARDLGMPFWLINTLLGVRGVLERLGKIKRRIFRGRATG